MVRSHGNSLRFSKSSIIPSQCRGYVDFPRARSNAAVYGSIRLRPTRIGFLVSPTNVGEVRRIMQVCTCLWGGAFNPIIPVYEETPEPWSEHPFPSLAGPEVTRGYLDFFEPDLFVESETGLAAQLASRT